MKFSELSGIDGLFRSIRIALKMDSITVRVSHGSDPQSVSYEWAFGRNTSSCQVAINSPRILAEKANGNPLAEGTLRSTCLAAIAPILLEHDGHFVELEPAPADTPLRTPMVRKEKTKPIDVEPKRGIDVGDVEKRHCL
jgi:hypothetical protein